MSILQRKLHEFPARIVVTGLVLLFASVFVVPRSSARPIWLAVSVLLVSFITISVYRTINVYRRKYHSWAYLKYRYLCRRRMKAIHREVENREKRILADVTDRITALDTRLWLEFPDLKALFNQVTRSRSVALFEDDSRQLGSAVVMNVLSRLGFKVSTVEGALHFEPVQVDVVLVGTKVYPQLVNQYLAEVYPWRNNPRGEKDAPLVIFANDTALEDQVIRLFGEVVHATSSPIPLRFWRLVSDQIVVAITFWAAHSDQRHRLFVTPDLPHERDTFKRPG